MIHISMTIFITSDKNAIDISSCSNYFAQNCNNEHFYSTSNPGGLNDR
jgi:hypothetical protein